MEVVGDQFIENFDRTHLFVYSTKWDIYAAIKYIEVLAWKHAHNLLSDEIMLQNTLCTVISLFKKFCIVHTRTCAHTHIYIKRNIKIHTSMQIMAFSRS